jgi:hypothetical protein
MWAINSYYYRSFSPSGAGTKDQPAPSLEDIFNSPQSLEKYLQVKTPLSLYAHLEQAFYQNIASEDQGKKILDRIIILAKADQSGGVARQILSTADQPSSVFEALAVEEIIEIRKQIKSPGEIFYLECKYLEKSMSQIAKKFWECFQKLRDPFVLQAALRDFYFSALAENEDFNAQEEAIEVIKELFTLSLSQKIEMVNKSISPEGEVIHWDESKESFISKGEFCYTVLIANASVEIATCLIQGETNQNKLSIVLLLKPEIRMVLMRQGNINSEMIKNLVTMLLTSSGEDSEIEKYAIQITKEYLDSVNFFEEKKQSFEYENFPSETCFKGNKTQLLGKLTSYLQQTVILDHNTGKSTQQVDAIYQEYLIKKAYALAQQNSVLFDIQGQVLVKVKLDDEDFRAIYQKITTSEFEPAVAIISARQAVEKLLGMKITDTTHCHLDVMDFPVLLTKFKTWIKNDFSENDESILDFAFHTLLKHESVGSVIALKEEMELFFDRHLLALEKTINENSALKNILPGQLQGIRGEIETDIKNTIQKNFQKILINSYHAATDKTFDRKKFLIEVKAGLEEARKIIASEGLQKLIGKLEKFPLILQQLKDEEAQPTFEGDDFSFAAYLSNERHRLKERNEKNKVKQEILTRNYVECSKVRDDQLYASGVNKISLRISGITKIAAERSVSDIRHCAMEVTFTQDQTPTITTNVDYDVQQRFRHDKIIQRYQQSTPASAPETQAEFKQWKKALDQFEWNKQKEAVLKAVAGMLPDRSNFVFLDVAVEHISSLFSRMTSFANNISQPLKASFAKISLFKQPAVVPLSAPTPNLMPISVQHKLG